MKKAGPKRKLTEQQWAWRRPTVDKLIFCVSLFDLDQTASFKNKY